MSSASLFLCHRLPFPPNKGDKIRSHALFKHLAERGPVHLACFIDDTDDLQYRDEVVRLAGGKCLIEPINKATKGLRAIEAVMRGSEMPFEEGQFLEATLFGLLCASEDTKEGMNAFLEKRPAQFKGR